MAKGLGENLDINIGVNVTGLPQIQQVQTRMKNLNNTIQKSTSQYNANVVATNKWAKGALQQAGYQVGDFAVQVANGTSAVQAFGQQGSQLLGIFGPIGAVLGAGVAIVSAVGVAFQKAGKGAKNLEPKIRSLSSALKDVEGSAKLTGEAFDTYLTKTFGEAEVHIQSMVARLEQIRITTLSDSIADLLKKSSGPISEMTSEFDRITKSIIANQSEIEKLGETASAGARSGLETALEDAREFKKNFGLTTNEFQIFLDNMERLRSAQTFDELVSSIARIESHLKQASAGPIEEFRNSLTSLLDSEGVFDRLAEGGTAVGKELDDADNKAKKLGTTVLSTAEAMFLLSKGILPPQAKSDLIEMDGLYAAIRDRIKQAADEAVRLGKTTLSAVEAEFMLSRGSLPDAAREDFPAIDKAYQAIRKSIEDANTAATRTGSAAASSVRAAAKAVDQELSPAMKRMKDLSQSIEMSFEAGFMSIIDGTSSVSDAFRSMASSIIKELYRVFVVKRITGFISDAIGFAALPASGTYTGSFGLPNLSSGEGGGYTGNGARAGGLDGKGGFMAMLHPRETIVDHTKGQGGGVIVNQTINVSTGVQQTVRTEIKQLMPQIADAAKSAVVDAKLRGGSYGRAFA